MRGDDRFEIYYKGGEYKVSIPRYEGGEVVRAWVYDAAIERIASLEAALRPG